MSEHSDSASDFLFVALIVADERRRRSLAAAVAGSGHAIAREFGDHPVSGDLSGFARLGCDVAIVDLDSDIEQAVRIIESICGHNPATTVMAYSETSDLSLARRAMQAGARDFLAEPLFPETLRAAFGRIATRRTSVEKTPGKILVFMPSKRGVGVTSLASNFAIALTRESGARVVVVDMDLQLGDIALGLGLTADCSVADALRNPMRLDREFLASLLVHHGSGLAVLGSPEEFAQGALPDDEGANKVFQLLREEFDYVVVDCGTCNGRAQESLFEMADRLYLITELTFPALRNAHRLMSCLSAKGGGLRNLDVVLNRCDAPHGEVEDGHVVKAIGRPADWRVPHGHAAASTARDTGVPLAMENSAFTASLVRMAKAACGKPADVAKTHRLFRFLDSKARTVSPG